MTYKFAVLFGLSLLPFKAIAQVSELPLNSDYCAIKYAMTGELDRGCAPSLHLGQTRSLNDGVDAHVEQNSKNGYFIHFGFNSDNINGDYQAHLTRLANVMNSPDMSHLCFKLVGHTDNVGSSLFNQSLSERRAQTVRVFLVGAAGVDEARVLTEGRGESELLPTLPGDNARNRRVEILAKQTDTGACG